MAYCLYCVGIAKWQSTHPPDDNRVPNGVQVIAVRFRCTSTSYAIVHLRVRKTCMRVLKHLTKFAICDGSDKQNHRWRLALLPRVNLSGITLQNAPVGLSVIGPRGSDRYVLQAALAVEKDDLCV